MIHNPKNPVTRKLTMKWNLTETEQKVVRALKVGELVTVWHPEWVNHSIGVVVKNVSNDEHEVMVNEKVELFHRDLVFVDDEVPVRRDAQWQIRQALSKSIAEDIDNQILNDLESWARSKK